MADLTKTPSIHSAVESKHGHGEIAELAAAHGDSKALDVAAQFLASIDPSIIAEPVSDAEKKKVLRKIDWILVPILSATCILAAVDKVIIANAALYGMKTDTHLVGQEYSWVGSIFYFGYLVAEFPAAYLIQRYPVAKFLVGCVTSWGALMMIMAATQNFAGLATCRFLMGMAEVPVFAVSSIITAMWWTRAEQPIRVAFWFNQGSSIFAGVISYGLGHTDTSVAPWRLLFLVLGGFTLLWAVFLFFFLPDSPVTCWYFSDREKFVCLERVRVNNTGVEEKRVKWGQVRECLLDPKTWLLALFALAQNIPNGGLVTFSSLIVSGLGYSKLETTLLGIPTGVIATLWQLIWSFFCARFPQFRCVTIAGIDIITMICAVLMYKLPRGNKQGLLAAYYCFYTYWGPYVLSTSLPMANTSGHSKKLTMNGIFFLSYCIGNIIGPQLFQTKEAPYYDQGYEGLLGCIVVAMAAILGYGFLCHRENKKRDAVAGKGQDQIQAENREHAFTDLTDKEKPEFRYVY